MTPHETVVSSGVYPCSDAPVMLRIGRTHPGRVGFMIRAEMVWFLVQAASHAGSNEDCIVLRHGEACNYFAPDGERFAGAVG